MRYTLVVRARSLFSTDSTACGSFELGRYLFLCCCVGFVITVCSPCAALETSRAVVEYIYASEFSFNDRWLAPFCVKEKTCARLAVFYAA